MYFVANIISDLLNYVVFVLVNLIIDIYMLVQLRKTLSDKLTRLNEISDKKVSMKKSLELEETMNNAIRMVVINSLLNLAFKLPLAFIPMVNAIAAFYYQSQSFLNGNFAFDTFLGKFRECNLYYLILDLADWLVTLLISIQMFVFVRFDKKIKFGFERIFNPKSNYSNQKAS